MANRREFLLAAGGILAGCEPQRWWRGEEGPFAAPSASEVDAVSHVLGRLTFGARGPDYGRVKAMGVEAFIEEQLAPEKVDDSPAERMIRRIDVLSEPLGELYEYKPKVLLAEMTRAAVLRAVWSRRQLYEVMVQFWTDHFNIDSSKGDCKWLKAADDRDVIRPHAMGRFPEMLRASALSPAMLWYLDGRVNQKRGSSDKPNENYARELLELHTLGIRGGYTQQDVMEVARCLTGWTVRSVKQFRKGRVEFQGRLHDDGEKTVMGERIPAGLGARDLDRVLEIVSLHPATARHIGEKLCRRFIADDPAEGAVAAVAESFLSSRGEVRPVLRTLFARPEFWASRREKVKRPFEFVVSALRATGAETDGGHGIAEYLLRMGHAPFQYPTPDGYSDQGRHWVGTLLWRWKFAAVLSRNGIQGTKVDLKRLLADEAGLTARLLGRQASEGERASFRSSGNGLALLLASPGFQRC